MSFSAAWSLQTSLYQALSGDAELQEMIGAPGRVFDYVPSDAVFPMLQIGAVRMTPYSGLPGAFEHITRITAFSRWGGRKECKLLAGHVHRILQNARLPMEGHDMCQARLLFEDHLKMRDPDLVQASLRYRFVTAERELGVAA